MNAKPIDVWDVSTFDPKLVALLDANAALISNYLNTEDQIFRSHDLGHGRLRSTLRPNNPHASAYLDLLEEIGHEMNERTIRAFHYTRLTDEEVKTIKHSGIHLSTPETLQLRLDAQTATGALSKEIAKRLFVDSPFHSDQLEARTKKFWMVSHPISIEDGGVEYLLRYWGGEVVSMWIEDEDLLACLTALGRPRIIEVAVPLCTTNNSYSAAAPVVKTFATSQGSNSDKSGFDLYTKQPLPSSSILAVHTDDDVSFLRMGRGYPAGFIHFEDRT